MDSKKMVEEMIQNYPDNLARIESLQEEAKHFIPLTEAEVLEMLTLPGKTENSVRVQRDVDTCRVMTIATTYRRLTWLINQSVWSELSRECLRPSREVAFVEYAIRALPRFYRDLMTVDVLEDKSWSEVCQHFAISGAEFSRKKEKAIRHMARTLEEQYQYFGLEELRDEDTRAV
ncbi:MAG: hypothetical protein ACOYIS_05330 [Candidatus Cloacimonadaceae bacterium]|jgi:hypothetical protein